MARAIRVKDLPDLSPSTPVRNWSGTVIGHMEPRRPLLLCERCGGQYSATKGDYFAADPNEVIRCCGQAVRLVMKQMRYADVS